MRGAGGSGITCGGSRPAGDPGHLAAFLLSSELRGKGVKKKREQRERHGSDSDNDGDQNDLVGLKRRQGGADFAQDLWR